MKRNRFTLIGLLGVLFLFLTAACDKLPLSGKIQENDEKKLQQLYEEIEALANEYPCQDPKNWLFTEVGAKACGGPTHYIAYSVKLDQSMFLEKVRTYTQLQQAYNVKWGVISDCMALMPPNRVICEKGKPKLIWDRVL